MRGESAGFSCAPEDHPVVLCRGESFRSPSPDRGVGKQPSPPGLENPRAGSAVPEGRKNRTDDACPPRRRSAVPPGLRGLAPSPPGDKSLGYSRRLLRGTRAVHPGHKDAPCRLRGSSMNAARRVAERERLRIIRAAGAMRQRLPDRSGRLRRMTSLRLPLRNPARSSVT